MRLYRRGTPVAVMVAGTGIIATRCVGLALVIGELGLDGFGGWLSDSAEQWDTTLLMLAAWLLFCLEVRCGFAVLYGRDWGRWCYLACQCLTVLYILIASVANVLPPIFYLSAEDEMGVLQQLLEHKAADVVMLLLLFVPRRSQRFFMRHK
ncbi:YbjO family protein [Lonsdalea britannica]|uniref:YbjO family protein n=1 Tax=Lonsdalea britannica TaxID=1082704 RepID=UPI0026EE74BE|nr:YbjO family protein [Lonsdalea britannica]